jgi:Ca-activated chloride channel homolog
MHSSICSLLVLCLSFFSTLRSVAQVDQSPSTQGPSPYRLVVPVDEVSVIIHAEGTHGEPIAGLTLKDLAVMDNGKPPRQVVAFEALDGLPIRAGIVIDTSRSARAYLNASRRYASLFATFVLDGQADKAFLMRFDSESKVLQEWTSEREALATQIAGVGADSDSRMGGTVLYDSLYRACRDHFTAAQTDNLANVVLLFSDGLDNASHAWLQDDVEICQRNHVSIYAVSPEPKAVFDQGQKILRELSFKTGGGLLFDEADGRMGSRLRTIVASERGAYRLVYKPAGLKSDGKFHTLQLTSLRHGIFLRARTGYYAPSR